MQWPHSTHAHLMVSTTPLTSTVKSSLFTHVHCSPLSPWLQGYIDYIDVVQTILIILTMVGLFPDTPHVESNEQTELMR